MYIHQPLHSVPKWLQIIHCSAHLSVKTQEFMDKLPLVRKHVLSFKTDLKSKVLNLKIK